MSGTTGEQIGWITSFFGPAIAALLGMDGQGADESPETVEAIEKALKSLADELTALEKLDLDTKHMRNNEAELTKSVEAAKKLADEAARTKAFEALGKRIGEAVGHARALSKSVTDLMAGKEGKPGADQKTEIYKKALEYRYGIKITIPDGMTNTHLDRAFDMFGSIPKEHAAQDKLKKLIYVKDGMAGGGSYNSGSMEVKMGDFGDATGEENFEIDGEKIKGNSFDITTLHEVGHAVDNKNSIMKSNGAKAGCGEWKSETVESITTIYLAEAKKTVALSDKVTDDLLKAAIKTALAAGTTAKPDTIEQPDWAEVLKFLVANCLPIRSASKPWYAGSQVVVGSRVYQEAYSGQWWSYGQGARAATRVNQYQWRAPGEWFAEIYSLSWLKKKPPPSAVDAAAAAFMWKG